MTAILMLLLVGYILWRVRRYNRLLKEKNRVLYQQISRQEKAEEEQKGLSAEPTEHHGGQGSELSASRQHATELSQNQQLYRKLCELMRDPEVYTQSEANHETLARLAGTNYKYVYDALRECAGLTPADFMKMDLMHEPQTGIALDLEAWTKGEFSLTDEQRSDLQKQADAFCAFIGA